MSKKHHPSQETENGMVRGLQNRHVQLIAIAGTIGTGLFLGAGRSLSLTGPSIILVYMLTGAFMYLMMRAIGEMLYMDPDPVSYTHLRAHETRHDLVCRLLLEKKKILSLIHISETPRQAEISSPRSCVQNKTRLTPIA